MTDRAEPGDRPRKISVTRRFATRRKALAGFSQTDTAVPQRRRATLSRKVVSSRGFGLRRHSTLGAISDGRKMRFLNLKESLTRSPTVDEPMKWRCLYCGHETDSGPCPMPACVEARQKARERMGVALGSDSDE